MDKVKIAQELVKLAKSLTADSGFTISRPLKLKPESGTSASLENAKLLLDAGYELIRGWMVYDGNRNVYELEVVFSRESEPLVGYTFNGFSFGYAGQGSRGFVEFLKMFGYAVDEDKVFANGAADGKGVINIENFA